MKRQLTITEAKQFIESKCKNAPLSKHAAYFQNESHIRVREDKIDNLMAQGNLTAERAEKMKAGYIQTLKAKYL